MSTDVRATTRRGLLSGGPDANEQLTAMTGAVLIVLLAVLGVTILLISQLIWLHLFLGLLLLGPVALKLLSTGYRFVRYYSGSPVYVEKGPPHIVLRSLAPLVVFTTVTVFASGIWLMFVGPPNRSTPLLIHKASFILWLGVTALHVLGHLPAMGTFLRGSDLPSSALDPGRRPGGSGRWIVVAGAVVGGLLLALMLMPNFSVWTAPGAFPQGGDR